MKKIVTILGARPQFIKAAVLSRIIREKKEFNEIIVHTGQHYDLNMSDVFFSEMDIPKPTYNLKINGLQHGAMTGQMLEKIEEVLLKEQPEVVVVYGDTNSTLAGALAAKKIGIKVVHVEAGLRSFNMKMPEEVNRILTDRICSLLLCPTETAIQNLQAEGFSNFNCKVINSGDIMKDAAEYYATLSVQNSDIIQRLNLKNNDFVLATIHRQENTDDINKLIDIFQGLERINLSKKVVIPLHPRTKKVLEQNKLKFNLTLINPVGYFDMLALLKNCNLVITDSGGVQKEAFFNKKNCIIAREETEWLELVTFGYARLVGSDKNKMLKAFEYYNTVKQDFSKNIFGNQIGLEIYNEIKDLLA